MKPLDPRLLKYAAPARRFIIEIAIMGILVAAMVITSTIIISAAASPVINRGAPLEEILPLVGLLAVVFLIRGALLYWREARAHRAADSTIATLRSQVLAHSVALGPRWRARNGAETTTLVTRGLEDLDPYFVKFLPQLILVVTVTPATLITILVLDFWSALIAAFTVPLIPIFMALIGRMTQSSSRRRLLAMERLGSQLLDLITGLPTLKALGRERAPEKHLERLSAQSTKTTMQTLRIAFLSGGVLEFLSTLSVALVAVSVGFRMVVGDIDLFTGLIVIMLAPEVYEPLRQVGAQFHASANGVAAADEAFAILDQPIPVEGDLEAPSSPHIRLEGVSVAARGTWAPADLTADIDKGSITALAGPSGVGKTTTVMVILGLEKATRGSVFLDEVRLDQIDLASWWKQVAWVPQSPILRPGTLRDYVGGDVSQSQLEEASRLTGFTEVIAEQQDGWDTVIGDGGTGLSVGQRQRLALTKVLVDRPDYLFLDEPTAHLDAVSEEHVVSALEYLRQRGTTIVVIAHRQAVLDAADRIITVHPRAATAEEMESFPQLRQREEMEDLSVPEHDLLDPALLEDPS